MIDNLLVYFRTGKEQETKQIIDVRTIMEEVVQQFDHDRIELGFKIELDLNVNQIPIYPILFKRLLTNLIGNAIKYRGSDPPEIKISCFEENEMIRFHIKDNGIGIPADQLENIFKIFKTLGQNADSNGIGLSVCKKIVELHGGEIGLQYIPGQGSTFHFTISKNNLT